MKKVNVILDEVTILNFPFLWKLIKRYYILSGISPILVMIFAFYFYYTQNIIYTTSISFKNIADESDSPTSAIAKLLGESTSRLSPSEVVGIVRSADFHHRLAERVSDHPKFKFLDFNSLYSKKRYTHGQIFGGCHEERKCVVGLLRKSLGAFFEVQQDTSVNNKFRVVVKSLDQLTATVLLKEISELIEIDRINTIKHFLVQQREISEDLVSKKKKDLRNEDIIELKDKIKSINFKLQSLDDRLMGASRNFEGKKARYLTAKLKNNETSGSKMTAKELSEIDKYRRIKLVREKIETLNSDIRAIEFSGEAVVGQNKVILGQLKEKLKEREEELAGLGGYDRSVAGMEDFITKADKMGTFSAFDLKIFKKEYTQAKKDYLKLAAQKEKLVAEKIKLDHKMEELRPSFEYLKLLETKTIQLKLVESTVVSDLVFEKQNSKISRFKRTTKSKIMVFSFIVTLFLSLISVVVRYLTDSRIYDEYELKKNFEDLEIIGNTPDFN